MTDQGFGGEPGGRYTPGQQPQAPYPQQAQDGYPSGPPQAPPKRRRGLIIGVVVAIALLCGLGGCAAVLAGIGYYSSSQKTSAPSGQGQALKPSDDLVKQRGAWLAQLQDARKLADSKQYDKAYDVYFSVMEEGKEDSQTVEQAISAFAFTFNRQMGPSRLPKQLDQAVKLRKRLPAGADAGVFEGYIEEYLVGPVTTEARRGQRYLDDRRQFIKAIRDKGKGRVYFVPTDDRLLTEAEAVDAQGHLQELGVSADIVRLYELERPLAAAMDRFFADDSRYLGEKTVSRNDINELASSCDALDQALVPVQRQLDRVKPGWRP